METQDRQHKFPGGAISLISFCMLFLIIKMVWRYVYHDFTSFQRLAFTYILLPISIGSFLVGLFWSKKKFPLFVSSGVFIASIICIITPIYNANLFESSEFFWRTGILAFLIICVAILLFLLFDRNREKAKKYATILFVMFTIASVICLVSSIIVSVIECNTGKGFSADYIYRVPLFMYADIICICGAFKAGYDILRPYLKKDATNDSTDALCQLGKLLLQAGACGLGLLLLISLIVIVAYDPDVLFNYVLVFNTLSGAAAIDFLVNVLVFIGYLGVLMGIVGIPIYIIGLVDSNTTIDYHISLEKHICLLLLTGGVWLMIWIVKATAYTNRTKNEPERTPISQLLLCLFVPFYIIYWTYKTAQRIDAIAKERGMECDLGTVCLILEIFLPFLPPIFMQDKINQLLVDKAIPTASEERSSNIEELKKYKELLNAGVITQEEFDAKKKQLLGL